MTRLVVNSDSPAGNLLRWSQSVRHPHLPGQVDWVNRSSDKRHQLRSTFGRERDSSRFVGTGGLSTRHSPVLRGWLTCLYGPNLPPTCGPGLVSRCSNLLSSVRTFIPLYARPSQVVAQPLFCVSYQPFLLPLAAFQHVLRGIPNLVCILYAQDELATSLFGKEMVEKGGSKGA